MHQRNIHTAGDQSGKATRAMILLHGRGADARDILSLVDHLEVKDYALFAPQATNHTWYPFSFMAPVSSNEPWLSSALEIIGSLVREIAASGIATENIYLTGFSQGACLTLEYAARNAKRYGGVIAFTGGLIGETINRENYSGNFSSTPIFIGSSDPDPHVPVSRVKESSSILSEMGAQLNEKIYPGMGHTITLQEINSAREKVLVTSF